jgi:hypothetical protein
MRITLGQLREMVEQVAGGGSGWVPAPNDIDADGVERWEEDDMEVISFLVRGPWERGPLKVVVGSSYLFAALSGRSSDPPTNTEIELWWTRPMGQADWEETGMQLSDLAMAADAAGILL